ncbi:MAG: peptide ABC transporter substrate-binding protein, partial [Nostocaceae cyanobacterium]|nr:peptide ABC transporter substrate-binding protein [Nostocaceae cyanobacterium]
MNWFPVSQWRKFTKYLSLFSVCLFLVISCTSRPQTTGSTTATATATAGDGRVTIGTTSKPRTLDPADAYELASLGLVYNMSDRLYAYPPGTTEVKPQLATALPKVSADGLTYTIPVRQGVM